MKGYPSSILLPAVTPSIYDFRSELGNQGKGDGAKFRGRGLSNSPAVSISETRHRSGHGRQMATNPELANDPAIAGKLLAAFAKTTERAIKEALIISDLRLAPGWSTRQPRFGSLLGCVPHRRGVLTPSTTQKTRSLRLSRLPLPHADAACAQLVE